MEQQNNKINPVDPDWQIQSEKWALNQPTIQNLSDEQKNLENQNSNLNYLKSTLPKFFQTENHLFQFKVIISVLILIIGCAGLGFATWSYINHPPYHENWFFAPGGIVTLIGLIMTIVASIKLHFWRTEIKAMQTNFSSDLVSTNVRKIYEKLIVSFSNINWFAFYCYILGGVGILINFIVFYGLQTNTMFHDAGHQVAEKPIFGAMTYGNLQNHDHFVPEIIVWTIVGIAGFVFVNQIFWQIFNLVRIKRIEAAYQVQIISSNDATQLKVYTNKRNFMIFLAGTIILAFGAWLVYRTIKRK